MTDYLAKAEALCGHPPVGNPDEMRRYAGQLRTRANAYANVATATRSALADSGLIAGGFARRAKRLGEHVAQAIEHQQAPHTAQLADYLERAAAKLEADQEAKSKQIKDKANELMQRDLEKEMHGKGKGR